MASVSPAPELILKPVEFDEELRLANDLMAKPGQPNYFSAARWFETSGAGYPGFRREHTRIALRHGELAGALRVSTDTIHLGEARLKMGGLGWVTTAPRHRHKGVCTALMTDTLRYLRAHRYHVSMLFGIPNFYHRFGYATTFADYVITVDTLEALSTLSDGLKGRRAKPGDIPAVQKIHALNDDDVRCSLVRTAAHFTNKWDRFKAARVLTDPEGKVMGYVLPSSDKDKLAFEEVGVATPSLCADILALCAAMAQESYAGLMLFQIPPGHPFAHFLLQYESTHQTCISRERGGMMAFVDLAETLESMIPEWDSLLSASALRDRRCEVTLVVDGISHRVRANKGAIDTAQMPGTNKLSLTAHELMQLLTGYRHLEDVLNTERRFIAPDAKALLEALFPKRDPYVWPFDRF